MIRKSMFKRRRLTYQRQPRIPAKERAPGTGVPPVKSHLTRLRRDALFALLVLQLAGGTVFALASGGAALQQQGRAAGTTPPPHTHLVIGQARVIVDRVASGDAGLMQPAVDQRGNVWVGEMYANRFARFDSQSEAITTWLAPHGNDGIMDATVDAQGHPWFVEQDANYIARFDPAIHNFRIFPLGKVGGRPLGPQDLQFDQKGLLWFTASIGGRIGRLDPTTGRIQTWPVPAPAPGMAASPYSLAVTPGGQVWFGLLSGGAIGHFDPATGHVTLYHLADPQAQIFSMASDRHGRIWFTEMVPGKLGMFDPTTKKITEIPIPAFAGHPAALYGLVITPGGDIWFANSGANALVRYSPATATYTFYQLSTSYGGLYGVTLDASGRLWFTIDGNAANYIGELSTRERDA
jgi:streptogramin lyase